MLSYIYQTVWLCNWRKKKNSAIHCLHKKDRFIYFKLVKVHEDLVSMINSRNLKDDFGDLIYVNDSFLFICEDNL